MLNDHLSSAQLISKERNNDLSHIGSRCIQSTIPKFSGKLVYNYGYDKKLSFELGELDEHLELYF